jgi:hypothetical protein
MLIVVGGNIEMWGLILSFLDPDDPRSAKEQFNAHYGWQPFEGFTFDTDTGVLQYPGDPPMKPLSSILFREEMVLLFDFGWVMVLQTKDMSWEICRMD